MRYSRSVLSIVVLISLILTSFLLVGNGSLGAAPDQDILKDANTTFPPSRQIVMESENNGGWTSADQLPGTSNSTYELHGNISSSSDRDFFKINLNGGAGSVDKLTISADWFKMTSGTDLVVVWISAFYPDQNSENVILVNFYDEDRLYTFWTDMSFHASYTGMYGIRFEPYNITTETNAIKGNMEYNFTISISSATPRDATNDQGSSQSLSPGKGTISTDVNVVWDMMDWYSISAPDPIFPTKLDMQVSLVSPFPDATQFGIYYGVELDVYVKYNTRSNPGSFQTVVHKISVGTVFQNYASCDPSPKDILIEKNCTEMYIGIVIKAYGIDPNNPSGRTYQVLTEGRTNYGIKYEISANIPNKRPQLLNADVDKTEGVSDDTFTFSVIYRDPQNESAKIVELWKNREPFRIMTPVLSEGENYATGVRYETEVLGSQIGPDGIYEFNVSCTDGKDWAVDPESGLRTFSVKIDNNEAPKTPLGDYKRIECLEDSDPIWINLDQFFNDFETTQLSYSIFNEDKDGYFSIWRADNFTANIVNNGTENQPEWRLFMNIKENVNGEITIIVNGTDGGTFSKSSEVDFIFTIEPVNDPPVIVRVGGRDTEIFKETTFTHLEQGELEEIRIVVVDEDEGDVLTYTWDVGDILTKNMRGTDFDFDSATGDLWFYTTDGDVPGFDTIISVSDGNGGYDEVLVTYEIENINDPPFINVPAEKSTIEGEYLYITPEYGDPDMDSGEIISFSYYMGALESVTPSSAIEFSQSTGRLVIKAVNEEMNGEWEINITVVDLYGAADWGICKVVINNINDPPVAYPINVEQEDENLTVIFRTLEAEDEDEDDSLTYIWDFGDGSDPITGLDLRSVEHIFPTAGAFTVTLTVSDGHMSSEVREIILTVSAPPPNPDIDGDRMLNEWEIKYGLDPTDPSDADLDLDEDGLSNYEEYDFFVTKGIRLNPWNPDTDGDGYDDGDEVKNGYDPIDPGSHPDDPNKDISFLLWMGAVVLIVLFLLAIIVFIVLKVRNRPEPVASPTGAIPTYQELPPAGYYEQVPPDATASLPPASGSYGDAYDQNQGQVWPASSPQEQYAPQVGAYQYGDYNVADQQGDPQESYSQGFGQMEMQPAPEAFEDQYQSIKLESTPSPFVEQPSDAPTPEEPPSQEPPQLDQVDGTMAKDPEDAQPSIGTETEASDTQAPPPNQEAEGDQQENGDQSKEKENTIPPPPDLIDA